MRTCPPNIRQLSAPAALLVLGLAASPVRAVTLYDAVLGLPEGQGWARTEQTNPPASIFVDLGPGGLRLDTTHLLSSGDLGGALWWSRGDLAFDFTQDFAIEASVRIVSAPDHAVNTSNGWPRPGYGIALSDVNGNFLWIGLGSGEVFLSHTAYGAYNSSNTVHASFNTTDDHHVYRIERGPGGIGAALRIDGALVLHLPTLGSPDGSAGPPIYFGDLTFWANSESHTAWVRHIASPLAVGPPTHAGLLSARALGTPARSLRVEYRAGHAGALSFEVFDTAGRRLERSSREVSAGESGVLAPTERHRDGLYFYRVRLTPESGPEQVATGRITVVR